MGGVTINMDDYSFDERNSNSHQIQNHHQNQRLNDNDIGTNVKLTISDIETCIKVLEKVRNQPQILGSKLFLPAHVLLKSLNDVANADIDNKEQLKKLQNIRRQQSLLQLNDPTKDPKMMDIHVQSQLGIRKL